MTNDQLAKKVTEVLLEADANRIHLGGIRATLYTNFVSRTTDGIHFTEEETDKLSTHDFMFHVLKAYSEKVTPR